MNVGEFVKDFISDKEVVTVSAVQLKKLLLQQDRLQAIVSDLTNENIMLKKAILSLKQQVIWEESQKPRHINLEA